MENRLIIAGFGGQGVMMMGQLLCAAAIGCSKEALFLPHYGPEQRGGTANCTVTLSDGAIGSPIVRQIDVLIAMNQPSLAKFAHRVREGGVILANGDLCQAPPEGCAARYVPIPVETEAERLGSPKVANMVMLGAYNGIAKVFPREELLAAVEKKLGKKPQLLEMNRAAVCRGMELAALG
ncbi:MAG: 2-oxoacid:ferredoxin oxidoreductase subunit gamma [Angelakisella sp.]|jgi:2-oxoglutarate ferredoxin oxidoreductase subunit gamma|nr:2-oxoacid:ferredoxin oxidoreductase subunit gamma [Angelakisella sp.]